MSSVLRDLDHADIVVANLTGNNPNVMYELGIRHGLGKPTVIVTEDDDVPYDLKGERFFPISLEARDLERTRQKLQSVLEQAAERAANLEHPVNPVVQYFTAPLTEISPAPGLALGYYRNFAQLTVRCLFRRDPVTDQFQHSLTTTSGEAIAPEARARPTIEIVRPNSLAETRHDYVTSFRAHNQLVQCTLHTERRPMTVFIRPGWSQGVRIVDVPTTMNVIEESIEMRLGGRMVVDPGSPQWQAIERDEISRFFSVLQRLIRADRETAFLQETVQIVEAQ